MKFLGVQQTPSPGSALSLKFFLQYLRSRLIYKVQDAEDEMN